MWAECAEIDTKVKDAKVFGVQINDRLDSVLDPTLLDIDDKYEEKFGLVDNCDELYDDLIEKIKDIEGGLVDQLTTVDECQDKLDNVSPINNPSHNADNKDFVQ